VQLGLGHCPDEPPPGEDLGWADHAPMLRCRVRHPPARPTEQPGEGRGSTGPTGPTGTRDVSSEGM
jgi:hypothetical protein